MRDTVVAAFVIRPPPDGLKSFSYGNGFNVLGVAALKGNIRIRGLSTEQTMKRKTDKSWNAIKYASGVVCLLLLQANTVDAQQVTVATPSTVGSAGFFEYFGVGFGMQHVGRDGMFFFRHGGGLPALPPFGGFDPSQATTFGIGGRSGDFGWNLNLTALQGSSYQRSSITPMLTLENGGFGFLNDTYQQPFVIGFTPVVGDLHQQRELKLQEYRSAASDYIRQRQSEQQDELQRLDTLRATSRLSIAHKPARPAEPPLRLGIPSRSAGDTP